MKKNYYKEIDDALICYETNAAYKTKDIDWICDRIDWCHKWRKITPEQMRELADRAIVCLKKGVVI